MTVVKLGKNAASAFAVHISLPKGIVDLKAYCKVNGGSMLLSDNEMAFAMASGLGNLIESKVVSIAAEGAEVKYAPKMAEVAKPVIVEVPVVETPVTAIQMTVEKHTAEGGELEGTDNTAGVVASAETTEVVQEVIPEIATEVAPDAEATSKPKRRRV